MKILETAKRKTPRGRGCRAADKYGSELFCEASDPDVVIPMIVRELKAAGSDKIIAAVQEQLREFFKK